VKSLFNYFAISLLVLCFSQKLEAQNIISRPETYQSIVDEAGILNTDEKNALKSKLDAFESQTGNELIVVTVNSLMGTTVELYASKLFNEWGIGKKGLDNGILLLIAVKDRRMRIETGYGVEEKLTDTECARLLDEILKPNFKSENYYEGIEIATNYIIKELNKDFNKEQFALKSVQNIDKTDFALEKTARLKDSINPWFIFFVCFASQIGLSMLLRRLNKKRKTRKMLIEGVTIIVSLFFAFISITFFLIFALIVEKWLYSNINIGLLYLNAIAISIYLLTLLPEKIFLDLMVLLLCAMVSMAVPFVAFEFTDKLDIYFAISAIIAIILFVLYKRGKFKFLEGGSGSTYTGSGFSYSESSNNDSSSSYDGGSSGGDSSGGGSSGGGSSGGGGASDSW
jgi:uncharacterized protein